MWSNKKQLLVFVEIRGGVFETLLVKYVRLKCEVLGF